MENDSPKRLKELRDRAEQMLSESSKGFKDIPAEDIQNTIHELQVHQIELEMQNDELRKTQVELEESRSKYVDLYDFAPAGYFTIGNKGMILEVNLTGAGMLGVERRYLIGKPFSHFITSDTQDVFYCHREKLFETKAPQTCELKLKEKNGVDFHAQLGSMVVRDAEGNFNQLRIAITDITLIKRAEQTAQDACEYAENIVETVREPLVVMDADLTIMSVNRSFCQTFEVTHEETEGRLIYELGDFQWDIPALRELLEGILPRNTTFDNFKVEHDFKKIGRRIMLLNARRIYRSTNQLELILLAIEDVTERKRLEAQIRQAQRMEAVGSLAGGLAHDLNNLLMAIQGYTSLMLLDTDTIHPHYKKFKNIQSCIQSGAELTRQLLGFAGGGKYEPKPTNLNEITKRATRMFGLTKKEVKIHTKYQEDIWTVEVDQGQIVQVLLNIYVNACQAMPGGGKLYLQTENVTLDEDYVESSNVKPGKYVKISITDTGLGMEEATQERIFDPFFTTKEMGKRTGFGLPSAYGIIKNHGGIISVFSEKGETTTFDIYLPASEKEVTKQRELPGKALKGKENVLLVDDEAMIIDVGREMLKALGYEVFTARSGREAIEVYEANKEKIDIVLLDIIMPDIGGGEAYDRMKEINPNIKVLLSSGYSIDGQAKEILARGCLGFMQKPFNLRDLSEKLRGILDLDRSLI